jgi:hypothetical protein
VEIDCTDEPGGILTVLTDPVGAEFALIRLNRTVD